MESHNKGRVIIYTLGGGYLIYLAYQLFTSETTSGNVMASLLFSIFFLLAGIVILGFAVHIARKEAFRKEDGKETREENVKDTAETIESDMEETTESRSDK